jgi:hypothetical protein
MSGRSSRRRGADAERRVAAWLRQNGWADARRSLAGDGRQATDIDIGDPRVGLEVKDRARSSWPSWQRQAAESGRAILVVVRRSRGVGDVGRWEARLSIDGGGTWRECTLASAMRLVEKAKLAERDDLPDYIVRMLAEDEDPDAWRRELPAAVVAELAEDADPRVREAIAWRLELPADLRDGLATDPHPAVARAAERMMGAER